MAPAAPTTSFRLQRSDGAMMVRTLWNCMSRDARDAAIRQGVSEGMTSGEIAAKLGCTRNSVIGRAHRAGIALDGRTAGINDKSKQDERARENHAKRLKQRKIARERSHSSGESRERQKIEKPASTGSISKPEAPLAGTDGKAPPAGTAVRIKRQQVSLREMAESLAESRRSAPSEWRPERPQMPPQHVNVVPASRNLKLVELTNSTCRWPIGDPVTDDFGFCGNAVCPAGPYCGYHAKLAYTPASRQRRAR